MDMCHPFLLDWRGYITRRDAGVVELDSLENCCGVSHRGFESHSLRSFV